MPHYCAQVDTSLPRDEVFAYLSDFSTAREWDPGVVDAERVLDAPPSEGAQFRLEAEFLGRTTELTYRIVDFAAPASVTFFGENANVVSCDRITFEETEFGTRITYDANLHLKGPIRLADPLLAIAFRRVGDRALRGLKRRLARLESDQAVTPTATAR
jgi:hypothetical protein